MQKIKIAAIVAMSDNRVIGVNNQLPWHLPADLRHFKELTTNHAILMGRKTYESIGRPLPNRLNLIISRDRNYKAEGCHTVQSFDAAIEQSLHNGKNILYVIGGAEIYTLLLDQIEQLDLTLVHTTIQGDTFFPALDANKWHETARVDYAADDKNEFAYSFVTLVRR